MTGEDRGPSSSITLGLQVAQFSALVGTRAPPIDRRDRSKPRFCIARMKRGMWRGRCYAGRYLHWRRSSVVSCPGSIKAFLTQSPPSKLMVTGLPIRHDIRQLLTREVRVLCAHGVICMCISPRMDIKDSTSKLRFCVVMMSRCKLFP
jgi:hypothetical protein